MKSWARLRLLAVLIPALCVATPGRASDPVLLAYVDQALDIMETHSLMRESIDWPSFRAESLDHAGAARTQAQAHTVVENTLARLGDRHSFLLKPEEAGVWRGDLPVRELPRVSGRMLEKGVAYLELPGFDTGDMDAMRAFAGHSQALVAELDAAAPCGWILDIRKNAGGNLWPLLAAVGPLLGDGGAGAFSEPGGRVEPWGYANGVAWLRETGLVEVPSPYAPDNNGFPVAVLTDKQTASAGEALAVAFRGRPATRSFGERTLGLSSMNRSFPLDDGAVMMLTTALLADRSGRIYEDGVEPDRRLTLRPGESAGPEDRVARRAWAWLQAHSACRP